MSETMIERVARAISDAIDPTSGDPIGVTFHHSEFVEGETMQEQLEQVKSICLAAARAAIEAMREMTDEMVEAFAEAGFDAREAAREENRRRKLPHPSAIAECQWVPQAFRAAIDAALSQDTHSLPSEDR